MHEIQQELLKLSRTKNLAQISLRKMAELIDMPKEPPQKIKHHLLQLQKKGFLRMDKANRSMERAGSKPSWSKGLLKNAARLFSIPIVGTANCGPANIFAEQNFQGFLRASSKLIGRSRPDGLYAVKADGSSMNRAEIGVGKVIEDGDLVIVDSAQRDPLSNDIVLAIIDGKATIKRFVEDRANEQVVLKADSSFDYAPIYLHPDEDFSISGKVIGVIKNSR
jgi:SOS-response transcriptional repressor LexA